uniref:Hedgehog/Intein (Hint) domain-containing protein n=1 Tax=viral metagenome TaxID=1070528 RepID=A0A6C0I8A6_9ZZZZ
MRDNVESILEKYRNLPTPAKESIENRLKELITKKEAEKPPRTAPPNLKKIKNNSLKLAGDSIIDLTFDFTGLTGTVIVTLPLKNFDGTTWTSVTDVDINWGDLSPVTTNTLTHTYTLPLTTVNVVVTEQAGTVYNAFGAGDISQFEFIWDGSEYLTAVNGWGDYFIYLNGAFKNTRILEHVPSALPPHVQDLSYMFFNYYFFDPLASLINDPNIALWNMSTVTDISGMFFNAIIFDQDISNWERTGSTMINVNSLYFTFAYAYSFNQPIGNWKVDNVTDLYLTFTLAYFFDQDLNGWNTHKVTSLYGTFGSAFSFNNGNSTELNWDTSSVETMFGTFAGDYAFFGSPDYTIFSKPFGPKWVTHNVTDMSIMFWMTPFFNSPINDWDTSKVTDMSFMFAGAQITDFAVFGPDPTEPVISQFNQPLSSWNTSNVTGMERMFYTSKFNQDISMWNVTGITGPYVPADFDPFGVAVYLNTPSAGHMLDYTPLSILNYNLLLYGWSIQSVQPDNTLGAQDLVYTDAVAHYQLTNTKKWTIVGDQGPAICYARGTQILCDTGYIAIEDLEPGTLVKTHGHGYREVDLVGKGSFRNDPSDWKRCMYTLPKKGAMTDDLVVTGGHGILKPRLSSLEIERDRYWYSKCGKSAKIDNMYLVRAGKSQEFKKVTTDDLYEYYHFSLKGPSNRRYAVWANGVLSESAYKKDVKTYLKL